MRVLLIFYSLVLSCTPVLLVMRVLLIGYSHVLGLFQKCLLYACMVGVGVIVGLLSIFHTDLIPCTYEIKCSDKCNLFWMFGKAKIKVKKLT